MSASEYRCVHRFECVTGGQQKARITSVGWNLNKDKEAPLAPIPHVVSLAPTPVTFPF